MKKLLNPILILICLLLLIIVFTRECNQPTIEPQKTDTIIISDTIFRHDTIKLAGKVIKSDPIETIDCVFLDVDTAQILADYNRVKIYKRKLWADKLAYITTFDTVYQNSLLGSKIEVLFRTHDTTIIRTKIVPEKPRNKVYIGFSTALNEQMRYNIYASALFQTKREHLYAVSIDPFDRAVMVSCYWKIRFKK